MTNKEIFEIISPILPYGLTMVNKAIPFVLNVNGAYLIDNDLRIISKMKDIYGKESVTEFTYSSDKIKFILSPLSDFDKIAPIINRKKNLSFNRAKEMIKNKADFNDLISKGYALNKNNVKLKNQ